MLGKVGKVVKVDSDGDVAVAFGNKAWVFNPACCEAAPGEKVYESSSGRRVVAGAGAAERASGGTQQLLCFIMKYTHLLTK